MQEDMRLFAYICDHIPYRGRQRSIGTKDVIAREHVEQVYCDDIYCHTCQHLYKNTHKCE